MDKFSIMLVDDEDHQRTSIKGFLEKKGYKVSDFPSVDSAIYYFKHNKIDLIISDLKMPEKTGKDLLMEAKAINPNVPIIITTAYGELDEAIELMKIGASDFLQKPIALLKLLEIIKKFENFSNVARDNSEFLEKLDSNESSVSFSSIIYSGNSMKDVISIASRVATSKASVLVRGESGTGKELIARAIHDSSPRAGAPFVVVNCAALPDTLFESELFGYEKGAFTGAVKMRLGKFEQADGGTLFIDEVGDIPLAVQVKLLRALQFGEIERLGGEKTIKTDVRIVAATNRNLEEMILEKAFREDLLYRLNVVTIELPPLRKRKEDLRPLIESFIRKYCDINGKSNLPLESETLDALMKYDYPGNVRELENIIQRAVVLERGSKISTDSLPSNLINQIEHVNVNDSMEVEVGDLNKTIENIEIKMITKALELSSGNQVKAAELLNISERTIRYKISKYGI